MSVLQSRLDELNQQVSPPTLLTVTPTVWVVHPVRVMIDSARQWGTFRYINRRYVYPDELSPEGRLPPDFKGPLDKASREFLPSQDWLLVVGDQLQLLYLTSRLARLHPEFKILRFDRFADGYLPVVMESGSSA